MSNFSEDQIRFALADLLKDSPADTAPLTGNSDIFMCRLIRWEADIPLTEDQKEILLNILPGCFASAGLQVSRFNDENDTLTILLACTHFPAKFHRDTQLLICILTLLEEIQVSLEQEGTLFVGEEFPDAILWRSYLKPMAEYSEWWAAVTPIAASEARAHRLALQTLIKRRQYTGIGGYVTRALRGTEEPGQICFAFIPLILEAIWGQRMKLSIRLLTEKLDLSQMTRKPRDGLLNWIDTLPEVLNDSADEPEDPPIDRVISHIEADCSLPYTQANLSRSIGLTPAYFCRLFHAKTGQHFSAFLTATRMKKAQALLAEAGPRSLQEISQACGYLNKGYFCQVFRKYTGLTPAEYSETIAGH